MSTPGCCKNFSFFLFSFFFYFEAISKNKKKIILNENEIKTCDIKLNIVTYNIFFLLDAFYYCIQVLYVHSRRYIISNKLETIFFYYGTYSNETFLYFKNIKKNHFNPDGSRRIHIKMKRMTEWAFFFFLKKKYYFNIFFRILI